MADAEYDGYGDYAPHGGAAGHGMRGGGFQRWINGAGAVTSVALIVGLGLWAYNLAMRDVRGIPVIRALEGPARVAPDNAGGELALYQGMAVNEVTADGTAGEAADQLTLAPAPGALAEEDRSMSALARAAADPAPPVSASAAADADPPFDPAASMTTGAAGAAGAPGAPDAAGAIAAATPGVAQSPRPPARPEFAAADAPRGAAVLRMTALGTTALGTTAGGAAAGAADDTADGYDAMAEAAAAAVAAALAEPVLDVAPETLDEGTRLVQIGAFPGEAEARREWDRVAARLGGLMEGKRRVIEPAAANGATFYRLRVEGFDDLEDARRFCAALRADSTECVPAVVR